jgi:hypothetical protein
MRAQILIPGLFEHLVDIDAKRLREGLQVVGTRHRGPALPPRPRSQRYPGSLGRLRLSEMGVVSEFAYTVTDLLSAPGHFAREITEDAEICR